MIELLEYQKENWNNFLRESEKIREGMKNGKTKR